MKFCERDVFDSIMRVSEASTMSIFRLYGMMSWTNPKCAGPRHRVQYVPDDGVFGVKPGL